MVNILIKILYYYHFLLSNNIYLKINSIIIHYFQINYLLLKIKSIIIINI